MNMLQIQKDPVLVERVRKFWKPVVQDFARVEERVLLGTPYAGLVSVAAVGADWVLAVNALMAVYVEKGDFYCGGVLVPMLRMDWLAGAIQSLKGGDVALLFAWLVGDEVDSKASARIENGLFTLMLASWERFCGGVVSQGLDDRKSALWGVSGVPSWRVRWVRNEIMGVFPWWFWLALSLEKSITGSKVQ